MGRILLVEDSPDDQLLVQKTLGSRYQLTCVERADEALAKVQQQEFDLVLIDVKLPDSDGFQVCAKMRSNDRLSGIPIVFLTGKGGVEEKVLGFSLGADDYVVKPFEPLEFRARIDSKLARFKEKSALDSLLTKGPLRVNLLLQKVFMAEGDKDRDLELTPIEFRILAYFARNEEKILSRAQLFRAVWGENVHVLERTVDKHVSCLRQKMGATAHYIETISGAGYRFMVKPETAISD